MIINDAIFSSILNDISDNYAGIHRPVKLYTTPKTYIDDITLNYEISSNGAAQVSYDVVIQGENNNTKPSSVYISLHDHNWNIVAEDYQLSGVLTVSNGNL